MNVGSWSSVRWRFLGLVFAIVACALLAVSLIVRVYGYSRLEAARAALEKRGVSFDRESYARSAPSRTKTTDWLESGVGAIVVATEDRRTLVKSDSTPWYAWDPALEEAAHRLLSDNECALSILHRLAGAAPGPQVRRGPALSRLYGAASLLGLEAQDRLKHGDEAGARRALATLAVLPDSGSRMLTKLAFRMATAPNASAPSRAVLDGTRELLPTQDMLAATRQQLAWGAVSWYHFVRGASLDELFEQPAFPLWARQLLSPVVTDLYAASILEEYDESIAILDRGDLAAPKGGAGGLARRLQYWVKPSEYYRHSANRHTGPFIRHLQGRRELVRAALELRAAALGGHAYPATRPALPAFDRASALLGTSVYAVLPDGSLELGKRVGVDDAVLLPPPVPASR
jgi:hypothetical protein